MLDPIIAQQLVEINLNHDQAPKHLSSPHHDLNLVPIRQSIRQRKQPSWMIDFVCHINHNPHSYDKLYKSYFSSNHTQSTYPHIISKHFSYAHISFIGHASELQEPTSYMQARMNPSWVKAMKDEVKALERIRHGRYIVDLHMGKDP